MFSAGYKAWYAFFLKSHALLIQCTPKYIFIWLKYNFFSLQRIVMLWVSVILTTSLSLKLLPSKISLNQAKPWMPYGHTLPVCQQQPSCSCNINQIRVLIWFLFYCCQATFQPLELPEQSDSVVAWKYTWC